MRKTHFLGIAVLMAAIAVMAGCRGERAKDGQKSSKKEDAKKSDHDHGAGPHGGPLAEWGDEEYHAEFTLDHAKQEATVYILGGDAKTASPIKADRITLSITEPAFQVELKPLPQDGDPKGTSSRFVGKHEKLGKDQGFAGDIIGEVNGKPYSGPFKFKGHDHDKKESKAGAGAVREAGVFLTPGGIYTRADIDKNGNTVPSVKFKGIYWSHDDNVKPGDRVCPVTDNKADRQCSWWINGERYEFCCPPCLEKFVKMAKESPEKVKAPEAYVKR
jgi:hypothetical protein